MIEFDEYRVKLNNLKPALTELGASLKLDDAQRELEELRAATEAPEFWNDVPNAQRNQQRTKLLEGKIARYAKLRSTWTISIPSARWRWRKTTRACSRSCRQALKPSRRRWSRPGWRRC